MDGIEEIQKIALNKSLEFREKYGEEESVLLSSVNKGEIGVYGLEKGYKKPVQDGSQSRLRGMEDAGG